MQGVKKRAGCVVIPQTQPSTTRGSKLQPAHSASFCCSSVSSCSQMELCYPPQNKMSSTQTQAHSASFCCSSVSSRRPSPAAVAMPAAAAAAPVVLPSATISAMRPDCKEAHGGRRLLTFTILVVQAAGMLQGQAERPSHVETCPQWTDHTHAYPTTARVYHLPASWGRRL